MKRENCFFVNTENNKLRLKALTQCYAETILAIFFIKLTFSLLVLTVCLRTITILG